MVHCFEPQDLYISGRSLPESHIGTEMLGLLIQCVGLDTNFFLHSFLHGVHAQRQIPELASMASIEAWLMRRARSMQ